MKKKYISKTAGTKKLFLSVLTIVCIIVSCNSERNTLAKIKMNNTIYNLEVADTYEKRQKGLMFRKKLPQKSGMIFVYSYADYRNFYMKNTLIPLDIAFIGPDLKILNIEQMAPLDETSIPSNGEAMYAIEMNKGFFNSIDMKPGDSIEILSSLKYNP